MVVSDQGHAPAKRRTRNTDRGQGDGLGSERVWGTRTNARGAANAAGWATPSAVVWAFRNADTYGHRFTNDQWLVLFLVWGGQSGYKTPEWVARQIGAKPSAVRQSLRAAERRCSQLKYLVAPAVEKQERIRAGNPEGERLTPRERRILDSHRYSKRGRGMAKPYEPDPTAESRAGAGGRDLSFSELDDHTRSDLGLDDDDDE